MGRTLTNIVTPNVHAVDELSSCKDSSSVLRNGCDAKIKATSEENDGLDV
jgi:hypothetical protein